MSRRQSLTHVQRVEIAEANLQNTVIYLRKLGISWGRILGLVEVMSETTEEQEEA